MTKIKEMDWAVSVVAAMQLPYEALRLGKDDEIAAALRKAKADGMREAAEIAYDFVVDDGDGFCTSTAPWMSRAIAKALREEADKLQTPTE